MGYKPGPTSHPDPWTSPGEGKAPEVLAASSPVLHMDHHPALPSSLLPCRAKGHSQMQSGLRGRPTAGGCLGPHLTSLRVSDGLSSPGDLVCHQERGPVVTAESPPRAFSGTAECKGAI